MNWTLHSFAQAIVVTGVFGILGILLCVAGFKAFDWITPTINIEHELAEKHNVAVAIVMAAVILGVSAIIIAAMVA
jgi:putative membrane protein